jgi:acylphosphatase
MITAHVFMSGFVNGEGYRRFVKSHAVKLDLTGWVRNLPDDRVEAVLQGRIENINKMILLCRKGPFLSEVKDISTEWEENTNEKFSSFEILH